MLYPRHRRSLSRSLFLDEPLEGRTLLAAIAWDGGGDGTSWQDALNWSANAIPTAADDVTINVAANPAINITGNATANTLDCQEALTLTSGSLSVAASATLRAAFNWLSGSLLGTGTKTLASGAVATLSGTGAKRFDGAILNNGTVNYTGSGFEFSPSNVDSVFTNAGTFNIDGNGGVGHYWNRAGNQFINTGALNKTAGTTTVFDVALVHSGTLGLTGGGLQLIRGGSSTVPISVAAGGSLDFRSDFTFNAGGTLLSGAGTILVSGGTVTLASASPATLQNVTLNGNAWIANSAAAATFGGTFNWMNGFLGGTGTKIIPAGASASLTTAAAKRFDGTVRIDGTMTIANSTLELAANNLAATLHNTGTVTLENGNIGEWWTPAGNQFLNAGTLNKNGAGTNVLATPFVNTGTVNLNAGTLQILDGGSSTTGLNVPAGTTLEMRSNFSFDVGGNVLGGAGTTSLINGVVTLASASPATLTNISLVGNASISNAAGAANFAGTLTWTSGFLLGIGVKNILAGASANLTTANAKRFDGQLNNNGTMTLTNAALAFSQSNVNAVFNNNGTLNLLDSDLPEYWTPAGNLFRNAGTLNKLGAGVSNVSVPFENTGALAIAAGGVKIIGTGSTSTALTVPASTSLEINSDFTFNLGGTVLSGAGDISITSGVTTFASATPATVINLRLASASLLNSTASLALGGSFLWNGGNLFGSREKIIPPGATATFATTTPKRFDTLLRIDGTANYTGSNLLIAASNVDSVLRIDGVFNSTGPHAIGEYWTRPNNRLVNNGAFVADSGAQTFDVRFENNGTYSLTGNVTVNQSSFALTGVGTTTVSPGSILDVVQLTQGALQISGIVNLVAAGTGLASQVNTLSLAGAGTLDLRRNGLIIDYTGVSPLATHRAQLIAGRNGGAWNGTGITSSIAATTALRAVGYGESGQILGPGGGNFMTRPVDGDAILLRYTRLGDGNLDRTVNFDDLLVLAQNYGGADRTWSQGNFDFDVAHVVNFDDLLILAQNYNQNALADAGRKARSAPRDALLD